MANAARKPSAEPSLAIVLHGRLGGLGSLLQGAPPRALRSFEGAQPSVVSAALCAASLERHVIAPNRHRWDIDVVGHSWSPEIGQTLDALFAPKRAVHEQGMSISNFKCPNPSFNLGFCHRTVSHVLGITKAMRVKEEEESARGRKYDMVFLSRWDVLWSKPLLTIHTLRGFHPFAERRRRKVWLPRICAPVEPQVPLGGTYANSVGLRSSICGGAPSQWLASQAANECGRVARACQGDMTAEARQLYVMDWWLVFGTSSDADDFAMGLSSKFSEHGTMVVQKLATNKRAAIAMGHAWFGAQLIWAMNTTLHHVGNIGVDFHLGRAWADFDCLGLKPQCEGEFCEGSDVQARTWQKPEVALLIKAWRPKPYHRDEKMNKTLPLPVTYPSIASPHQMAGSCEQRYFLCKKGSRMCVEDDLAMEHPMDRLHQKALFIGCAERLCAPPESGPMASTSTFTKLLFSGVNLLYGKRGVGGLGTARPAIDSGDCARQLLSLYLHVSDASHKGLSASPIAAEKERRKVAAAMAVLRERAKVGAAGGDGLTFELDAVCDAAWAKSEGGKRMPVFVPASNATTSRL